MQTNTINAQTQIEPPILTTEQRLEILPLSKKRKRHRSSQDAAVASKGKQDSLPVLDATAELLAYLSSNHYGTPQKDTAEIEQVATAFRLSPSLQRVHLVIAGRGITDEHVQCFHRIWLILRAIANTHGRVQEEILEEGYYSVVREVYIMCYDTTYRQIFQEWGENVLLHPDMKRPSLLGDDTNMDKLARIFTCVEYCRHFFKWWNKVDNPRNIEDVYWKSFATNMNQLTTLTHQVCSVKALCELWASLCDYHCKLLCRLILFELRSMAHPLLSPWPQLHLLYDRQSKD